VELSKSCFVCWMSRFRFSVQKPAILKICWRFTLSIHSAAIGHGQLILHPSKSNKHNYLLIRCHTNYEVEKALLNNPIINH